VSTRVSCGGAYQPSGGEGQDKHDRAVVTVLREQSAGQPWWLGYLDTGADDVVFHDAPKVTLYSEWHYVLVQAGAEESITWRQSGMWSLCSQWPSARTPLHQVTTRCDGRPAS
jgi:hypothetical protein